MKDYFCIVAIMDGVCVESCDCVESVFVSCVWYCCFTSL